MATWSMRSMILHMARPALPGRRHSGRRGAALVEFVIVFPVLLMLMFGMWEFGRIFSAWMVVVNAAREGARYAVATSDGVAEFQTEQYLRTALGKRLKSVDPGGDVAASVAVGHPEGEQVQVVVTADLDVWAPVVLPLMSDSGTFTVTAWSTMRQ